MRCSAAGIRRGQHQSEPATVAGAAGQSLFQPTGGDGAPAARDGPGSPAAATAHTHPPDAHQPDVP